MADERIESIEKIQEIIKAAKSGAPFNKDSGHRRWEEKKKKEAFDELDKLLSQHLGDDWLYKPAILLLILEFGRGSSTRMI